MEAYKCIKDLIQVQEQPLPSHDTKLELVNRFVELFHSKVARIREALDTQQADQTGAPQLPVAHTSVATLDSLSQITLADLHKLIKAAPSKSCSLDPAPTWFIKEPAVLNCILPSMLAIVNESLASGVVPSCLKQAEARA
jgi:hypothetical protein